MEVVDCHSRAFGLGDDIEVKLTQQHAERGWSRKRSNSRWVLMLSGRFGFLGLDWTRLDP